MRACIRCGALEERRRDDKGRPLTNINPITGECLDCLIGATKARPMPDQDQPYDGRAKAARNDA